MTMDRPHGRWFKSSHSHTAGECVEVAWLGDGRVSIRDSKRPDEPALVFDARAWSAFVTSVRNGEPTLSPS
ncbi:DUF397 domain-containing protein [Nocardia rhamnosiphila]|uniref:DUF397 domain-containing protein n=2 Tax=Nocardia rhamnosiphila TaxID=426716 RepID=UPI0009E0ACFD|nr:DUF397 domain-containing protein [Nocardia rhamnosiphila]